jgi:hypothetical protein
MENSEKWREMAAWLEGRSGRRWAHSRLCIFGVVHAVAGAGKAKGQLEEKVVTIVCRSRVCGRVASLFSAGFRHHYHQKGSRKETASWQNEADLFVVLELCCRHAQKWSCKSCEIIDTMHKCGRAEEGPWKAALMSALVFVRVDFLRAL